MAEKINVFVNEVPVEVEAGATLLEAAEIAGFNVPVMCHNQATGHIASCMVCLVKVKGQAAFQPSCSALATEGMWVITDDAEIREARKMALELLMSEHVGDCEAPCRVACPANMDIPQMNRLIAAGKYEAALEVIMKDIALPGVLGRICPAPCEGACRRKQADEAASICLLKRFVADTAPVPLRTPAANKPFKVGIIGAGPAGLSAAYYTRLEGFEVTLYDNHALPGGSLRYVLDEDSLERAALDKDVKVITDLGITFKGNQAINSKDLETLRTAHDCLILATGTFHEGMSDWPIAHNGKQVLIDKKTYLTNLDNVFAIGNLNRPGKLAIRSAAQGKEVAFSVKQVYEGQRPTGEHHPFNSTIGRMTAEEIQSYRQLASPVQRHSPTAQGYDAAAAIAEAERCMDCDCREATNCLLRQQADRFGLGKKRFHGTYRTPVARHYGRNRVVFEPGKCNKCGNCVRLTATFQETFGFTFIGRGFDVQVGVPFNETVDHALTQTAAKVAAVCPTGALSTYKNKQDHET